jgi:hypothetical protein
MPTSCDNYKYEHTDCSCSSWCGHMCYKQMGHVPHHADWQHASWGCPDGRTPCDILCNIIVHLYHQL